MSEHTPMPAEWLVALADAYLLGELDAAQLAELEHELKRSPASRALFATVIDQATAMREVYGNVTEQLVEVTDAETDDFNSILSALDAPSPTGSDLVDRTDEVLRRARAQKLKERRQRGNTHGSTSGWSVPSYVVVLGIAALFMMAFWLGGLLTSGNDHEGGSEATSPRAYTSRDGRTRLLATHQAVWGEGGAPRPWQELRDVPLELRTGLAKIKMGNGASLLVEGPARLRVLGPGQVQLLRGRVVATSPAGSSPLTVQSPSATIFNHDATSGVYVDLTNQTTAQVFRGEISLTPMTDGVATASAILLPADQALRVDARGQQTVAEVIRPNAFVSLETFEALRGARGSVSYARAVRRMWEHDTELIAAISFSTDAPWSAYGMTGRIVDGELVVSDHSLSPGHGQQDGVGGRMAIDMSRRTSLFFDLDLTASGPAAQAGLLRSGEAALGRDGTQLCISYLMRLDADPSQDPAGWFGLSLFYGSDDRNHGEFMFLGKLAHLPLWGTDQRRVGDRQIGTDGDGSSLPLPDAETAAIHLGQTVQWLIVVDCQDGVDHIAIYRDPLPGELGQPTLVLDDVDLRMDRLRIEASDGDQQWSLDELRIGTTPRSVLQN